MLKIIVLLLIVRSTHGKLIEDKRCSLSFSKCEESYDCCSKVCFPFFSTTSKFCLDISSKDSRQCFEKDEKCLRHEDCCSKNCNKIRKNGSGFCKEGNDEQESIVTIKRCIFPGHFCIADSDCCSGRCVHVKTRFDFVLHACVLSVPRKKG